MSQLNILSTPGFRVAKNGLVMLVFPSTYRKKCRRDLQWPFDNIELSSIMLKVYILMYSRLESNVLWWYIQL